MAYAVALDLGDGLEVLRAGARGLGERVLRVRSGARALRLRRRISGEGTPGDREPKRATRD